MYFVWYGGRVGSATELAALETGYKVGFDLLVDARSSEPMPDGFGKLAENTMDNKDCDAGRFQLYELAIDEGCGDWGYLPGDITENCTVDEEDLFEMAVDWLRCTDSRDSRCGHW